MTKILHFMPFSPPSSSTPFRLPFFHDPLFIFPFPSTPLSSTPFPRHPFSNPPFFSLHNLLFPRTFIFIFCRSLKLNPPKPFSIQPLSSTNKLPFFTFTFPNAPIPPLESCFHDILHLPPILPSLKVTVKVYTLLLISKLNWFPPNNIAMSLSLPSTDTKLLIHAVPD